jgi:branched-chain amino acid transport system permease protein
MTATTMAPAPTASSGMTSHMWRSVIQVGLIGAALAIYLCLVGIVPVFGERPLIRGVISLGQMSLVLTFLAIGWLATRRIVQEAVPIILAGAVAGAITGLALTGLIVLNEFFPLRSFLPNASPVLWEILTMESEPPISGAWIPTVVGLALGTLGAALVLLPRIARRLIVGNLLAIVIVGLFAGLLRTPMISGPLADWGRWLFATEGLTINGTIVTIAVTSILILLSDRLRWRTRVRTMPQERRKQVAIPMSAILLLIVLWLPLGLGGFVAQAIALIALYVLMGLGLNITLGLAGLLDLGFVAFFAVGAYTVGLLTSTGDLGIADLSFWVAVPFAVLAAMLFGIFLGLPILGIRGDYLAIATLGFGEIIAILARSDLLGKWLGGPQGITNIPKPIDVPVDNFLSGPNQIYYISLICAAVIAFVAYRLRGSRLGRAWVAIREDEDVAEALGVNLVQTKVLAYMLGAAFAGLGGAIFAGLVGAVFPSSINLYVSINVVAIVVVGGMGSIPGVIVGAAFLIGLPELFREFSEYRFLFYGLALMIVMRFRPEGLLPSKVGKASMQVHEDPVMAASLKDEDSEYLIGGSKA